MPSPLGQTKQVFCRPGQPGTSSEGLEGYSRAPGAAPLSAPLLLLRGLLVSPLSAFELLGNRADGSGSSSAAADLMTGGFCLFTESYFYTLASANLCSRLSSPLLKIEFRGAGSQFLHLFRHLGAYQMPSRG